MKLEKVKSNKELKTLFDRSKPIKINELNGFYEGFNFKKISITGSLLKLSNWKGKEFFSKNKVNALVHQIGSKQIKPFFGKAHLEEVNYNNKKSISMKYNFLPIRDHFRRIDKETIIGAMTLFGYKKIVFYFCLKKK